MSSQIRHRLENIVGALVRAEDALDDEGRNAVGPHIEIAYEEIQSIIDIIEGR